MQTNDKQRGLTYFPYIISLQYEHTNISSQAVVVYSYILARYAFFLSRQQSYYESIESIADNCCCSVATVKNSLRVLKDIGVVEISKIKGAKYNRNCYVVVDKYRVHFRDTT